MSNDGFKRIVDNKLRDKDGAYYGDIDYKKKTIRINKLLVKKNKGKSSKETGFPKKEMTVLNTIVHEEMHRTNPKMTEKNIRKNTAKKIENMGEKQKKKLYYRYT